MADSTCPKPDCIDSPLVSAASIMGIMTFIYAVLAGIFITYIQAMTTASELEDLTLSFESTQRQLEACRRKMGYFNEVLPKGATREELYHLYGILRRGEEIVDDPNTKKMLNKVSQYNHFNKSKRLRSMVAGKAIKDAMDGRLKAAQRVVSEVQLGLIQLKQDIINADQIARSNALFNMMLDSSKRPSSDEIARSAALSEMPQDPNMRPNGRDSSAPSSSDLEYPFGPRFQAKPEDQKIGSENEKSAILLRTQMMNSDAGRLDPADREPPEDPLGKLMRARTMSVSGVGNER